jgi:hypothetical protein
MQVLMTLHLILVQPISLANFKLLTLDRQALKPFYFSFVKPYLSFVLLVVAFEVHTNPSLERLCSQQIESGAF